MAYASASDVAMYTPWLLEQGASNFTATSRPTLVSVNAWLDRGAAVIDSRLLAQGYSIPIETSATVYDELIDLNAIYAVSRAESTRMSSRVAITERSRSQAFKTQFDQELAALLKSDLSQAGVGYTSQIKAGGLSKSDKRSECADPDRVQSRFQRGQFDIPGSDRPAGSDENSERD